MRIHKFNQAGFHLLTVAILIVVLGVVGFSLSKVRSKNTPNSENSASNSVSTLPLAAGSIKSKEDLSKAKDKLNSLSTDLDSTRSKLSDL